MLLYIIGQFFFGCFQFDLIKNDFYGKIYGGLGLLPVFMLSVYFSWLIILYGALIAARVQYHSTPFDKIIKDKNAESPHESTSL